MHRRVALVSTGGTIEKTYDELSGLLEDRLSVLDVMLASLQLEGVAIARVPLMNKDSLDMTPADHTLIATRPPHARRSALPDEQPVPHLRRPDDRINRASAQVKPPIPGPGQPAPRGKAAMPSAGPPWTSG